MRLVLPNTTTRGVYRAQFWSHGEQRAAMAFPGFGRSAGARRRCAATSTIPRRRTAVGIRAVGRPCLGRGVLPPSSLKEHWGKLHLRPANQSLSISRNRSHRSTLHLLPHTSQSPPGQPRPPTATAPREGHLQLPSTFSSARMRSAYRGEDVPPRPSAASQ